MNWVDGVLERASPPLMTERAEQCGIGIATKAKTCPGGLHGPKRAGEQGPAARGPGLG